MENHTRALFELTTDKQAKEFLYNISNHPDCFIVENNDASLRVSASSMLGLIYSRAEFDKMYLVNITCDGRIPSFIDQFRPISSIGEIK